MVLGVGILAGGLLLRGGCGDPLRGRGEIYARVIEQLQSGRIPVRPDGIAALPSDLQAASKDGQVWVSSNAGLLLVAFKTWRGKAFNMEGFLFCSRTLTPADVQRDYHGNSTITVGPAELTLEKQIDPQWYRVSRRLD